MIRCQMSYVTNRGRKLLDSKLHQYRTPCSSSLLPPDQIKKEIPNHKTTSQPGINLNAVNI